MDTIQTRKEQLMWRLQILVKSSNHSVREVADGLICVINLMEGQKSMFDENISWTEAGLPNFEAAVRDMEKTI